MQPIGGARFASARVDPDAIEDPDTRRWGDLEPHERRAILERDLRTALVEWRAGNDRARNVARAEATLSVLRAELMTSDVGAARYAELEAEVEALSSPSSVGQLGSEERRMDR